MKNQSNSPRKQATRYGDTMSGTVSSSIIQLKSEVPQTIDLELLTSFTSEIERQFIESTFQLEKAFKEQVHQIKELFNNKIKKFKEFNESIQANHELISQQYELTQKKLKQKLDKIHEEKQNWENDKRLIMAKNGFSSEVLSLNIGGTHKVLVTQKVLCSVQGSQLAKMFSGLHDLKKIDDSIFVDRDGSIFQALINFLRNDRKIYPSFDSVNDQRLFTEELQFWGIKDERLEEKRYENKLNPDLVAMLRAEPGDEKDHNGKNFVPDVVKDTWLTLGPLKLQDIVKNSLDPIQFDQPFGKSVDKYNTLIFGQFNQQTKQCEGICRQIFAQPNNHLYEGQCKNEQKRNGYGRQIYCDGNYYVGFWKDDKKNGWGKKYYAKNGKIEEGNWVDGELQQN